MSPGDCGGPARFVPGTYQSKGGAWVDGKAEFGQSKAGAKTLTIERIENDRARVLISYQRNGQAVVETWLSPSPEHDWAPTTCPPPVAPGLAIEPRQVDFGAVPLGQSARFPLTIRNRSAVTTAALKPPQFGGPFTMALEPPSTCQDLLGPGAACGFTVVFTPTAPSAMVGYVTVAALLLPSVTAELMGVGVVADAGPPDGSPDAAGPLDGVGDGPSGGSDAAREADATTD